jgi:CRP-like cAMP-binding protein
VEFNLYSLFFMESLPPGKFKRLLACGSTHVYAPGEVITEQGEVGRELTFLLSGNSDVLVDGSVVAQMEGGARDSLIGEITCLSTLQHYVEKGKKTVAEQVNATVIASDACVTFRLPFDKLQALIENEPDILLPLLNALANTAVKKAANRGVNRLNNYEEVLTVVLMNGRILAPGRNAVQKYRLKHKITAPEHQRVLAELGWTEEEFAHGYQYVELSTKMSSGFMELKALVPALPALPAWVPAWVTGGRSEPASLVVEKEPTLAADALPISTMRPILPTVAPWVLVESAPPPSSPDTPPLSHPRPVVVELTELAKLAELARVAEVAKHAEVAKPASQVVAEAKPASLVVAEVAKPVSEAETPPISDTPALLHPRPVVVELTELAKLARVAEVAKPTSLVVAEVAKPPSLAVAEVAQPASAAETLPVVDAPPISDTPPISPGTADVIEQSTQLSCLR